MRTLRSLALAAVCLAAAAPAAAQVPDWPTERPPRPTAPRPVKFPPYAMKTLPNGLQVIAVSHHEQPAITLRLMIRAGSAQDPLEKPGVASMAASLLDQGTTTKNAEQIATAIDSIGGAMGAGSGSDVTFVSAAVMRDNLDVGLGLIADIVRNPSFAPEEIERQRQKVVSALQVNYEDPDYLASIVFERLVYGHHPYGKPDAGTPQALAAITRDDLMAFHKRWFGANNAIIAVVGDATAEQAFAAVERAFGSWRQVEPAAAKPVEPPPPTRRVVLVDRPGSVQTEIRVGNIGLPRRHPDFLALDLALKILGGEGGNRLYRVLRSERGLTYGAAANMVALKESGHFVADTDTRSDGTAETLRLLVDEIARLQRQRVGRGELLAAQDYLTGSFPLTIETPSAIALQVLNAVFYGLDPAELETYRERVSAITPEDIQRAAQRYLHPDRLSIVLVGDASVFSKELAGVGFDQVERIAAGDLDLSAVDLRRSGSPAGGRVEPAAYRPAPRPSQAPSGSGVGPLVERALAAKGGLERLRSIKTIRIESTISLIDRPGGPSVPTTTSIRYPGAFRVDAMTPAGPQVQAFNAGEFWIKNGARPAVQAPAVVAAEMRGSVQRDAILLLLGLADGRLDASRAADITDGDRVLHALEVRGEAMPPVLLLLDARTGLVAALRYGQPGLDGQAIQETFTDYRDVEGLKVAFKATVARDGIPFLQRVVTRVELNPALEAGLFTRPS